MVMGR